MNGTTGRAGAAQAASAPGRTVIEGRALKNLAVMIAGEAAGVAPKLVDAGLSDARAALRVSLKLPAPVHGAGTLLEQAERIRTRMVRGMAEMAERRVTDVDIEFTGVFREEKRERRVR
ncbi:MAG: hypothetical protein Q4E05_09815 [Pseudoclavibacter sp.]|nr:hypothetical protein [Pseudoclavibacter sp.]